MQLSDDDVRRVRQMLDEWDYLKSKFSEQTSAGASGCLLFMILSPLFFMLGYFLAGR